MKAIQDVMRKFDSIQKGNSFLGFVIGVVKKFGDDQAGYLAALVAYYAFFSLFPLLLVFATVLGFVLGSHRASIMQAVQRNFPVLGQSFQIGQLKGSGIALAVGLVFALLAGIGVIQALQYAMDEVWGVPKRKRPNFFISRLRALMMLAVLGVAMLLATAASNLPFPLGFLGSLLLNIGIALLAFKLLTVADVTWKDILPGAVFAGVALTLLQTFGGLLVRRTLKNANATYGTFAVVIGLLSFIYLGAQLTIYGAEINAVKKKHLWPRSLVDEPTPGDQQVFTQRAKIEERRPDENIRVSFDKSSRSK